MHTGHHYTATNLASSITQGKLRATIKMSHVSTAKFWGIVNKIAGRGSKTTSPVWMVTKGHFGHKARPTSEQNQDNYDMLNSISFFSKEPYETSLECSKCHSSTDFKYVYGIN
jgi:hypothetical protein